MMSHVTVIQVTKYDIFVTYFTVTVTQSCDTEKNVEDSKINNII